eukprot:TRINITY_DN32513_c0_g1_i1.p1 TRINITY_DN32513_c0_g1~~TRINITY_DN32513_c0_g1_i1.p1  ORF type:complete len:151 (-),score=2.50 TRINITY_DN32513_c0_g1_i1:21-473(-)
MRGARAGETRLQAPLSSQEIVSDSTSEEERDSGPRRGKGTVAQQRSSVNGCGGSYVSAGAIWLSSMKNWWQTLHFPPVQHRMAHPRQYSACPHGLAKNSTGFFLQPRHIIVGSRAGRASVSSRLFSASISCTVTGTPDMTGRGGGDIGAN